MLIRNAEVEGALCDLRVEAGKIADILFSLQSVDGEQSIDASGAALLPGLHDHHIHLMATAAAMQSVRCGPPEVADLGALARVLAEAPGTGWLRGTGYHDSIGRLDRAWLDTHGPGRPVRIQHRGGRLWVLNSRAIDAIGIAAPDDGRLVDRDRELRQRLGGVRPDLAPLVARLLARGVTGVTDTTPENGPDDFCHLTEKCGPLHLVAMGGLGLAEAADRHRAAVGPLKLHYHDHDLPPLEKLASEIAAAHDQGRNAAMHCVTRAEIMLALAAFEEAGAEAGDRIEHAAVADDHIVEWTARLGLTVVTQPHFPVLRADAYRKEVEAHDLPHLWPLRRFAEAGVPLAGGSDSPFEGYDPWLAMACAAKRPEGLSPEEAITPEAALALFTKPSGDAGAAPRKIAVGEPADLCLIDRNWAEARADLAAVQVRATFADGDLVYGSTSSTSPHSSAV